MSALADIYIKKETLKTILDVLEKGGGNDGKGVSITVSINDDSNQYGQNVSSFISQSKEERDSGKQKFYIGNGKVFWTDGKIIKGSKPESPTEDSTEELPF